MAHGDRGRAVRPQDPLGENARLELRALEQDMEKAQGIGAVTGRVIAVIDRLLVAARPDLAAVFDTNRPPGARFDSTHTVDNGSSPHKANFSLSKVTTGQAIAEAMADR
ncbi:hypothetical protein [Streptomyces sp. NPDC058718]|uniref:hypothetical protein n=1 Tax=Streptomyces sp. NPDC058718 TaxID=3346610 RepID=UPI0036B2A968